LQPLALTNGVSGGALTSLKGPACSIREAFAKLGALWKTDMSANKPGDTPDAPPHAPSKSELPGFFRDPHPTLRRLREHDRVHDDPVTGSKMLVHFDDVKEALGERAYSKDPRKLSPDDPLRKNLTRPDGTMRQPNMLFLDPPQHTRLRSLVNQAFTPRALAAREPRIEAIAGELLDAVAGQPVVDVVAALARPLPVRVIGEMLGIPIADRDRFYTWSDAFAQEFNPSLSREMRAEAQRAKEDFSAYLHAAIEERRRLPGDDLLSELISAEEQGDRLSESELIQMCALLLVAGNMTTTDLIGNGVLALLDHPDQLDRLRRDPSLLATAVEEMLRYDSSVTGVGRNLLGDTEVAGRVLPATTRLHLSIAAANRDAAAFAEPDRFDVGRTPNAHVAFGQGVHFCLGAQLARAEIRIAVEALLARFSRMALDVPRQDLRWRTLVYFRGLEALPLRVAWTSRAS
jgi:cytochrome P450